MKCLFEVAILVSASLKVPWCEEVVAIIGLRNFLVSLGCSRGIFFGHADVSVCLMQARMTSARVTLWRAAAASTCFARERSTSQASRTSRRPSSRSGLGMDKGPDRWTTPF